MHHQCGMGNGCMGSMEDWVCVCEAFGWIANETDLMQCHKRKKLTYANVAFLFAPPLFHSQYENQSSLTDITSLI